MLRCTIVEAHQYFGVPDIYERGEWDDRNPDFEVSVVLERIKFLAY